MRTIKNISTGEEVVIYNGIRDTKEGTLTTNKQLTARFFNKYSMLHLVSNIDGVSTLSMDKGWEIVKNKPTTKPEAQPEAESTPEPTPEPTQPAPEAEDADTAPEPTPEPAKPTKPVKPAKPAQPAQPAIPNQQEVVNAFAMLTPLFAGVQDNIHAAIMKELKPIIDRIPQEVRHIIQYNGEERPTKPGEVFHANFDTVCKRIAKGQWVYLWGPTGSGKNVMAKQIADALGLNFYYQAHTLDRFELTGFIDANGRYQETEFYKAYKNGGLFMLDELDASDENALITLNSAANGYFAFPCGTIQAHPDFRVIAAGNTCGRGADEEYTGRHVIDASSLGRFLPRFHGYTREVDLAAANGDESLVAFFVAMREIKKTSGVSMILSPRQIKSIKTNESDEELSSLLGDAIATYLTPDDVQIVKEALKSREDMAENVYAKAFRKLSI